MPRVASVAGVFSLVVLISVWSLWASSAFSVNPRGALAISVCGHTLLGIFVLDIVPRWGIDKIWKLLSVMTIISLLVFINTIIVWMLLGLIS